MANTVNLTLKTRDDIDLSKITDLAKIEEIAKELLKSADEKKDADATTRAKIEMDIATVVGYYAATSKAAFYEAASKSGDRMMYAVKTVFYDTIRTHDVKDPVTHDVTGREITHAAQPVDLDNMNSHYGGIGSNPLWRAELSEYSWELNFKVASDIGASAVAAQLKQFRGNFYADKFEKAIGLGKNPVSNSNMLRSTRRIIGHMLGAEWESKVLSSHVAFVKQAYTKVAPKTLAGLEVLNSKGMCGVMRMVCSMLVLGLEPTIKSRDLDRAIKEAAKIAAQQAAKTEVAKTDGSKSATAEKKPAKA